MEAKRHPVFADSFEIGHEPYFVTAEEEGSWMPKMSDSSKHLSEQMHWVMVDLEGVRRINQLEVSFEYTRRKRFLLLIHRQVLLWAMSEDMMMTTRC